MKSLRRLSAIVAAALALLFCAGCGFFSPPTTPPELPDLPPEDNPDDPTTPDPSEQESAFTVRLVVDEDQPFFPSTPVYAQWKGVDGDSYTAQFNEIGVATCTDGLDGEYQVTISPVPSGYTYNCNGYTADNFHRAITVELLTILNPAKPDYGRSDKGDIIHFDVFSKLGTYRATFEEGTTDHWYQYSPDYAGELVVQSWVDISANEVNPKVIVYHGNGSGYINASSPDYEADGGGASSTYTKNFKLTFRLSQEEIQNVFYFRIFAETKGSYPVTVDFTVERVGNYVLPGGNPEEMVAEGPFDLSNNRRTGVQSTPEGTWRYAYADTGRVLTTKDENGKPLYGLWEEKDGGDGYWHKLNADGSYGAVLRALIGAPSEVLDSGFMYQLVPLRFNNKDYTNFIGRNMTSDDPWDFDGIPVSGDKYYSVHCDLNGAHPLTEELRIFLQEYAQGQSLFNDGNGSAEGIGLNAAEEDMWLFVVGYYAS